MFARHAVVCMFGTIAYRAGPPVSPWPCRFRARCRLAGARAGGRRGAGSGRITRRLYPGPYHRDARRRAEAGYRAGDYLGFRLDASALSFDYNRTISGIPYKFGVNLRSGGSLLDIYPFGGGFHLSGGARINGNGADVTAMPSSSVRIGGNTFTPAQLGTLTGTLKYNRFAPYLGIGYVGRVANWLELGLEAGVLYQGRPHVSLAASGPFANNPTLQAALAQENRTIENDLSLTTWYPAITFAALFRF